MVVVLVVVVVIKVVFGVVGLIFCCVILRHAIALKEGHLVDVHMQVVRCRVRYD